MFLKWNEGDTIAVLSPSLPAMVYARRDLSKQRPDPT